ncbi:low temperature requirement protein A [Demequina sp. NBRC 110057]|uniref:low temperature requirement protein A n=1 Tax=Demequina sp. NBRC 110057 TaxID=1570346 RepID=UPI0009FF77C8|nr:low temperature requirement protein A [Demequina sp. NBRC 110057]
MTEQQATSAVEEERHASWPELFFDLVVVAGAGLLAHLIEDGEGWSSLFLFAVAFGAFWMIWTCFTAYGNVRGDAARLPTFLVGMAVLSVMVAAVPGIHEGHAQAFAIAYVVGRVAAARPWHGAAVVVDLPVIQAFTGVLPWVVSFWVEGDAKYLWWAAGLTIDLVQLLRSREERVVEEAQERLDRLTDRMADRERGFERKVDRLAELHGDEVRGHERVERRRGRYARHQREVPSSIVTLRTDNVHLAERFGLFTLILLGEGLIQMLNAASGAEWDAMLAVAWAGSFALIVGLWNLAVRHGSAGVALLAHGVIPVRLQWVAHLVTSLSLVAVSAALGVVVAHPGHALEDHEAFIVAGALALYLLASATVHAVVARRGGGADAGRRAAWLAGAGVFAPAVVLLAREELSAAAVVCVLAAAVVIVSIVDRRGRLRVSDPSAGHAAPASAP